MKSYRHLKRRFVNQRIHNKLIRWTKTSEFLDGHNDKANCVKSNKRYGILN